MVMVSTNAFPEINNISINGNAFVKDADNSWIKQEPAIPQLETDLAILLTQSDLIVVGTVIARHRGEGNMPFNFSDLGRISYISEVEIQEIVASVWGQEDINRKVSLNKTLYVFEYPNSDGLTNSPSLLTGGQFILWLNNVKTVDEDIEIKGFSKDACYKVNSGRYGAIFFSTPEELRLYPYFKKLKVGQDFNPYSYQENLLKDCFGAISPAELLKITEDFSTALLGDASDEKLNNFANSDNPVYSNTAKKILKNGNIHRFKSINFK